MGVPLGWRRDLRGDHPRPCEIFMAKLVARFLVVLDEKRPKILYGRALLPRALEGRPASRAGGTVVPFRNFRRPSVPGYVFVFTVDHTF